MQPLSFDVSGMTCGGCTGKRAAHAEEDRRRELRRSHLASGRRLGVADPERVTSARVVAINALMLKRTKLAGIKRAGSPGAPATAASVAAGASA